MSIAPDPVRPYDDVYGPDFTEPPPDPVPGVTVTPVTCRRTAWNAAELMATDFPEPRFAVPGIVAEGVTLLVGPPKLGKSWLALGLSIAVASGGRALGRIPVEAGDALYLALEDNGRRLQSRLSMVLGNDPPPSRLVLATECASIDRGGLDRVGSWLDAHPDARLVVVDVLARIRGRVDGRAGLYAQDYAAIARLKTLADTYGVPVVVVHHTRKGASEDFLDTVSGTQGLAGAADAVLVLTRARNSADGKLKLTGRDVTEAEYALSFDAAVGTWVLLDEPPAVLDMNDTRRRVLTLVIDQGPQTPKAIADLLDLAPATARQTVKRMTDAGQLDTDGACYFAPSMAVTSVTLSREEEPLDRDTRDRCDAYTGDKDAVEDPW